MRVLNKRQLDRIPMVDAGNLYLGELSDAAEAKRSNLQNQELRARQQRAMAQQRASNARRQQEYARDNMAGAYAEMLQRSLRNTGRKSVVSQSKGKQYGVNNPLLGFVDETTEPNFSQSEVYKAPEFSNTLTAKDCKGYTKFKDWPLVLDAPRGDFGGILTNEAGSPDFSQWIVDDARTDFGYVPRPRRRR